MTDQLVLGIPPSVINLVQQGLLQRAFHDGLYPNLGYRSEALFEEWPANAGTEHFMTRAGILPTITEPLNPGDDPTPQDSVYEQWSAVLRQFAGAKDIHMPSSVVSNANVFLREIKNLGLQSAQSINRVARNTLFKAHLAGSTVTTTVVVNTDTNLKVAALNGFTTVITSITVRPVPVSNGTPMPITVGSGGAKVFANVIGVVPDDVTDPDGPGTLLLSAAIGGAGFAIRAPVIAKDAATIIRSAGGDSVDAIGPNDTLVLQQVINAVGILRDSNVPTHDDGFYHAHVSGGSNAQFFQDPVFQRLNQSLPEHVTYKEGFIGTIANVMFFMNTEAPRQGNVGVEKSNVGTTGSPGTPGVYAKDIGAEVVNGNGVKIGRVIITGKGSIYEKGLDESLYGTEAGYNGKVGEFDIVNNGIQVVAERIRLVLRAPIDRLQQKVGVAWSITTSFATPSDITAPTGPQRFKRSVCLEHAL